jgi:hypothetical protein
LREPVTTDRRISFIDRFGRLVVYDRALSCSMCRSCLADALGTCMQYGPFNAEGIMVHRANALALLGVLPADPQRPVPAS